MSHIMKAFEFSLFVTVSIVGTLTLGRLLLECLFALNEKRTKEERLEYIWTKAKRILLKSPFNAAVFFLCILGFPLSKALEEEYGLSLLAALAICYSACLALIFWLAAFYNKRFFRPENEQ